MADEQPEDRAKKSSKAAGKKAASKKSAKKDSEKKSAAEQAPGAAKSENVVVKNLSPQADTDQDRACGQARYPAASAAPQTVLLKARNQGRRASRLKTLLRNKGAVKSSPAACEVAVCTEAALREKLRIAAPYVEIWLSRRDISALDAPTPEAAFVRIWQWLTLEARLDDRRIVTAVAEEVGGERS